MKLKLFWLVVVSLIASSAFSQSTKAYNDFDSEYKKAKELFQQDAYSIAFPIFKDLLHDINQQFSLPVYIKEECQFYTLVCGLVLDDATYLQPAIQFSNSSTSNAHIEKINFYIGEYYFRKNDYINTINFFNKTSIDNLTNLQIATMKFHKGYSYFTQQKFNEAKPLFNSIRQIKTDPNYIDANYYYGFLCFYDKQYSEAKQAFTIVEQTNTYKNIVPFYLAEIYYFNGERDKALTYAEDALKRGNQFYTSELNQLVGHLSFDKKEYAKALPYLEYYVSKNAKVRREDLYELAFCYYAAKNYVKCIDGFKQLGGKEDSLAQNSMYLLADAYLKTNQKANARNAFLFCSSNSSNAVQKEVSTFNYAKLSYELGYLNVALKELQAFLVEYPKSIYTNETKEIIVSTLANTSNFKDALSLFESMNEKSLLLQKIYPRILYSRAVELINERQIDNANLLLNKLLAANFNETQLQLAYFWKGEIAYRKDDIEEAIYYFSNYLLNAQINGEVNINNAKYSLGYCWLKKQNYNNALQNFEYITKTISPTSSAIEQDAYLRSADCYFMLKQMLTAQKLYDNVINSNSKSADYAMYQKALIAGALNKPNEKISLLESIGTIYPKSLLIGDANLEIATVHMSNEKFDKAIEPLQNILRLKGTENIEPQAYLKLGVSYFNLDNNDEALNYFSTLSKKYPNTTESDESIEYIRNIFVETQKPEEFVSFMKKYGKPITYSEADSITYKAAIISYDKKDYAAATKGFENYLKTYADGKYYLEANFLLAEIFVSNKDNISALKYYETLAAKTPNKYGERSCLQAARIYYFDVKDIAKAEPYFIKAKQLSTLQENKLEAMRGLLRCQYRLQKMVEALPNAKDLLLEKSIASDDKMMALTIVAKNNQTENKLDEAFKNFKEVTSIGKSEYSAEASYRMAEILVLQNKLTEAEKAAFDCIKKYGSYEIWVTKSYLLLGDIYFKQKDWFNAEATYKSIMENATIEAIKKEAEQKLLQVIAEKNKASQIENNL
ncbi:MAG: tetratricopeptide repeat protein [Chitinophagaceae bacterium]